MKEPPVLIPDLKDAALAACDDGDWIPVRIILKQSLNETTKAYEQLMKIFETDNIIIKSCIKGYVELISVFITNNFPIEHHIGDPSSIVSGKMLNLAVRRGQVALVEFLVSHGANKEARNSKHETALHIAISNHNIDIVELLLEKGCNVNSKEPERSPLYCAVDSGSLDIVKLLIKFRADARDSKALHRAAELGAIDIITFLLQHGVNINDRTYDNRDTPLHLAIHSLEVVKYLIDQGANVNCKNLYDRTPLYCAVCRPDPSYDIVELLLNSGADVDVVYQNGYTILHHAVETSQKIVELLLEKGANVNATDDCEATVLYNYIFKCYPITYVQNMGINEDVINIVGTLVIWGADIDISDDKGHNLLHWAAAAGSVPLVKLMVEHGADVNARNVNGKKPINLAADARHHDVVSFLIDYYCSKYKL